MQGKKNLDNNPNKEISHKFDLSTAKCEDFIQWFYEKGHSEIRVGDGQVLFKKYSSWHRYT